MPFNYKTFDAECAAMTPEQLQLQWNHYTRHISGSSTSTVVSSLAIPFTFGISAMGVALAAPCIHNARKKRDIIDKHLVQHNTAHITRKRDVFSSMAISGAIGGLTLGVGTPGADALVITAAEYGYVVCDYAAKGIVHLAADGVAMTGEELHLNHEKKKEHEKLWKFSAKQG